MKIPCAKFGSSGFFYYTKLTKSLEWYIRVCFEHCYTIIYKNIAYLLIDLVLKLLCLKQLFFNFSLALFVNLIAGLM